MVEINLDFRSIMTFSQQLDNVVKNVLILKLTYVSFTVIRIMMTSFFEVGKNGCQNQNRHDEGVHHENNEYKNNKSSCITIIISTVRLINWHPTSGSLFNVQSTLTRAVFELTGKWFECSDVGKYHNGTPFPVVPYRSSSYRTLQITFGPIF